jgi:hypothetical protein
MKNVEFGTNFTQEICLIYVSVRFYVCQFCSWLKFILVPSSVSVYVIIIFLYFSSNFAIKSHCFDSYDWRNKPHGSS